MERLDVGATVKGAYGTILQHPRVFLTIVIPIATISIFLKLLLTLLAGFDGLARLVPTLVVLVASIYITLLLAVTWHRTVLMRLEQPEYLFFSTRRLWRFFGYGVLYSLIIALPRLIASFVPDAVTGVPGERALDAWAPFAEAVVAALVLARFGFVFPAVAIDRQTSLAQAWRQSSGIGLSFFAILLGSWLPFVLLGLAIDQGIHANFGENSNYVLTQLSVINDTLSFVIAVSAVSLAYARRMRIGSEAIAGGARPT